MSAQHTPDLNTLMVEHEVSVWMDPNWWADSGLPRWLAGKNIRAEDGCYYSTLTGSDPASIEADHTALGDTPLEAVLAVIAKAGGTAPEGFAPLPPAALAAARTFGAGLDDQSLEQGEVI